MQSCEQYEDTLQQQLVLASQCPLPFGCVPVGGVVLSDICEVSKLSCNRGLRLVIVGLREVDEEGQEVGSHT